MSLRHVKREDLSVRTSTTILTAANIAKMLVGISYLSVSMSISIAGIYTAVIGFVYVLVVNAYTLWLTIKTRNRFKHDKISDLCDLSVKLYGEGARKYFNVLLILCQALFLMAYEVFLGEQLDQLMCSTWKVTKCGHRHLWSFIMTLVLMPVILQKRLGSIGVFSSIIMIFTLMAVILIFYMCIKISTQPVAVTNKEYELNLKDSDRTYRYWNTPMLPYFICTMMNLIEGN